MKNIARQIERIVDEVSGSLTSMQSDDVSLKKSPDKWSKKEILGHLIDSAANNHQRFVRVGYGAAGTFPPYDQNEWVRIQQYNELDWKSLVALWTTYNRHLCNILERLPAEVLASPCNIGKVELVPLEFVITDYLRHLRHHLSQILGKEI